MTENLYLAGRIREVLLNGRWIANTNFKEQLSDVNYAEAIRKISGLNSIALLTFHIHYYAKGVLHAFKTGQLTISDSYSFDLPPIQNEKDWQQLVSEFVLNAEELADFVERMDPQYLHESFIDEKYGNNLRNIEAIIEHSYYHLGQVVLIKKMLRSSNQ